MMSFDDERSIVVETFMLQIYNVIFIESMS